MSGFQASLKTCFAISLWVKRVLSRVLLRVVFILGRSVTASTCFGLDLGEIGRVSALEETHRE
jgi:hypothetical protein